MVSPRVLGLGCPDLGLSPGTQLACVKPEPCPAGMISTTGEFWREQRRFSHTVLRDLGMGRSVLEHKIAEELSFFTARLREQAHAPFDPKNTIQVRDGSGTESQTQTAFTFAFDKSGVQFALWVPLAMGPRILQQRIIQQNTRCKESERIHGVPNFAVCI